MKTPPELFAETKETSPDKIKISAKEVLSQDLALYRFIFFFDRCE